jgi:hypothetical protein
MWISIVGTRLRAFGIFAFSQERGSPRVISGSSGLRSYRILFVASVIGTLRRFTFRFRFLASWCIVVSPQLCSIGLLIFSIWYVSLRLELVCPRFCASWIIIVPTVICPLRVCTVRAGFCSSRILIEPAKLCTPRSCSFSIGFRPHWLLLVIALVGSLGRVFVGP